MMRAAGTTTRRAAAGCRGRARPRNVRDRCRPPSRGRSCPRRRSRRRRGSRPPAAPGFKFFGGEEVEHVLLQQRVARQVGAGDVADELGAVAQRGRRRPALGHRDLRDRVVRHGLECLHGLGERQQLDLGIDIGADVRDVGGDEDEDGEQAQARQARAGAGRGVGVDSSQLKIRTVRRYGRSQPEVKPRSWVKVESSDPRPAPGPGRRSRNDAAAGDRTDPPGADHADARNSGRRYAHLPDREGGGASPRGLDGRRRRRPGRRPERPRPADRAGRRHRDLGLRPRQRAAGAGRSGRLRRSATGRA